MAFPENEAETIALYELVQNRIGWRIVGLYSNAFPDAVLESNEGEKLTCEFEYLSGNFRKHGHPVDDRCDLIVCWHDDWPDCPLPVMTLEDCADGEAAIIRKVLGYRIPMSDLWPLRDRIEELKTQLAESKRHESESPTKIVQSLPTVSSLPALPEEKLPDLDWIAAFAFTGLGIGLMNILPLIARILSLS